MKRRPAARRGRWLWLAGACLVAAVSACATNPVTGQRELSLMSEAQEIEIGRQVDAEVQREMGVYDDAELQRYVDEVGQRMARASHRPHLPWQFGVADEPAVNAFALPGGFIYLTRGILPFLDSEAQLAGVLGHEIGHVTARHAAQRYSKATGAQLGLILGGIFFPSARPLGQIAEAGLGLLFLKYSRDDELQADRLGAEYAAGSGWDPAGVAGMLTTLARIEEAADGRGVPNWLATHPHPADRVERLQDVIQEVRQAAGDRSLATNRDAYLRRIDGLVFGDNPDQGVVRGSDFLHPVLRFGLTFPRGWDVRNSPAQVVAKQPGAELYALLQLVREPKGRTLEETAVLGMRDAGFRRLEGDAATISGLQAYVGTYEGTVQGLGASVTRAAHIAHDRNIYLVAGLAPRDLYRQAGGTFDATIRSFRPLTRAEAAQIRPNRIDLYVVRAGDTWQSIAARAGEGIVRPPTLAIMNNYPVDQQPRVGDRIKIVVAG